jgi:hypothetical protein
MHDFASNDIEFLQARTIGLSIFFKSDEPSERAKPVISKFQRKTDNDNSNYDCLYQQYLNVPVAG